MGRSHELKGERFLDWSGPEALRNRIYATFKEEETDRVNLGQHDGSSDGNPWGSAPNLEPSPYRVPTVRASNQGLLEGLCVFLTRTWHLG